MTELKRVETELGSHLHWLGYRVRDKVTGFTGVVGTLALDVYGCIQVAVQPEVHMKDGEQVMGNGRWFDVTRLVKTEARPVMEVVMPRGVEPPGPAEKPAR